MVITVVELVVLEEQVVEEQEDLEFVQTLHRILDFQVHLLIL